MNIILSCCSWDTYLSAMAVLVTACSLMGVIFPKLELRNIKKEIDRKSREFDEKILAIEEKISKAKNNMSELDKDITNVRNHVNDASKMAGIPPLEKQKN